MQAKPSHTRPDTAALAFFTACLCLIGLWQFGVTVAPAPVSPHTTPLWLTPEELSLRAPVPPDQVDEAEDETSLPPSCEGITATDTGPRALYCRVLWHRSRGDFDSALEPLDALQKQMPRLADRFSLLEGDLRMEVAPDETACEAYSEAIDSPLRAVAAHARVGRVRCLLATNHPRAEKALTQLRWRYPRLPHFLDLELVRAGAHEKRGDQQGAAAIYRDIDLRHPGSSEAHAARARLSGLAEQGIEPRPATNAQRIRRLAKLVRWGPLELAHDELDDLSDDSRRFTLGTRARIAALGARLARKEGRFDDARELLREAHRLPAEDSEDRDERLERTQALNNATEGDDQERAQATIHRLIGAGSPLRQPLGRVYQSLRVAARAGLTDEVDRILDALNARRNIPPQLRFNAAITAAGVGDDEKVAQLFATAALTRRLETPARYHRARCLERAGRLDDAREEYERVIELDDSSTPFYAFWSRQRLPIVAAGLGEQAPRAFDGPVMTAELGERDLFVPRVESPITTELSAIAERLRPLAEEHGEAYPWLWRAVDLLSLNLHREATDELHEMFLAWWDARGRRPFRTGVESLYRGTYPTRHRSVGQTRRARRQLKPQDIRALANICADLGDHGLAVRFGGWNRANERPRAYEEVVRDAAERHGIDPNLLLAVMRVESVYNPRIISYAGAVGLMQIMPATGTFIARAQDRDRFTVEDLMEPEINIDFAAWYLASLIERFDGRIPLAVAAYNGGPHNVRLWLRQHNENMPLEAFLETIPFSQTHRYVRRVLTHYEAYRAQEGRSVVAMELSLPELQPDPVGF